MITTKRWGWVAVSLLPNELRDLNAPTRGDEIVTFVFDRGESFAGANVGGYGMIAARELAGTVAALVPYARQGVGSPDGATTPLQITPRQG